MCQRKKINNLTFRIVLVPRSEAERGVNIIFPRQVLAGVAIVCKRQKQDSYTKLFIFYQEHTWDLVDITTREGPAACRVMSTILDFHILKLGPD